MFEWWLPLGQHNIYMRWKQWFTFFIKKLFTIILRHNVVVNNSVPKGGNDDVMEYDIAHEDDNDGDVESNKAYSDDDDVIDDDNR